MAKPTKRGEPDPSRWEGWKVYDTEPMSEGGGPARPFDPGMIRPQPPHVSRMAGK